jgi:tRNA modification GTPase
MDHSETIAAISTPAGTGAIAVIRMSGADAIPIASKMFASNIDAAAHEGSLERTNLARHGYIKDPYTGAVIDEVVIIPFRAPATYTGEDLVEINCHGGAVITSEVLSLCLKLGARLARPGEFTQRAFMSGRIDLTQAEAVLDLIQAKTSKQGRMAVSALSGQLGQKIKSVRDGLMTLLTEIVAGIDFPEEIGDAPVEHIEPLVQSSLRILEQLSLTARSGKFLRHGLRVAIVGRPNAGKSSLLNQLLKYERAIVTEIAGTTRDSLEELLDLNGIPVLLVDTAGIRATEDRVERIGIERTHEAIRNADLVLLLIDLVEGWGEPEDLIADAIGNKPFIAVNNKVDLHPGDPLKIPQPNCVASVTICARSGDGLDKLSSAIEHWVAVDQLPDSTTTLNARQAELCERAANALRQVQETLDAEMPQDCLASDLKIAIENLSEICGEAVSEEVIHQVFANFCIGK